MAAKRGIVRALAEVKNVAGCVNFGCMAIDGMQAWGLKTNKAQTLSVLYYCQNVNVKVNKTYRAKNILGHGNGMTCDRNYLYFACALVNAPSGSQNRYILRVPRNFNGDWRKAVKITTPNAVTAISYYKKDHMIVRIRSDVPGYQKFAIGRITINSDGKSGNMEYVSHIYVKLDTSNALSQDIYFDPKKRLLFIPLVKRNTVGRLVVNYIFIADLAGPSATIKGSPAFTADNSVVINMGAKSGFTQFEVESLGLDSNRRIVLCANTIGRLGDHFFRITNLKF